MVSCYPSKFVTSPQFEIVDIAAGRSFAKELTRIEDSVVCLKIRVAVDIPSHFCTWPVTDEAAFGRIAGDQQEARNCIDTVIRVFAPLRYEVDGRGDTMRQLQLDSGMNIDKVHWSRTGIRQNAEVVADREDRVEGTQRVTAGVISAGDVRLDAKARA